MALVATSLKGAMLHFLNSDAPLLCKSKKNGQQLCKSLYQAHVLFNAKLDKAPPKPKLIIT